MSVELYGDDFFKKRITYKKRAHLMMKGIIDIYHPQSFIDCGAALGDLVGEALERGIDAYGIEGNEFCFPYLQCPRDKMIITDLSKPLDIERNYDVLLSLEVAEHIEEPVVDIFIENICKMSNILVISICDYGPTTKIHPTVKPHDWWIPKFFKLGFVRYPKDEDIMKEKWFDIRQRPAVKEAYRNLIIFKHE